MWRKSLIMSHVSSCKTGSILVFSLLILSLVTVMAIGIASSTVISRKAADATGKSAKAFQVADTGLERVLQAMYKNLQAGDSTGDLATDISAACDGGVVDLTTSDESWHATFHDEAEPSGANQMACADPLIDVVSIKVVGTYLGVTRAIDVRPSGYLYRGLIGHWEFEDGSGSTAEDSSVNDNNATLRNMSDSAWKSGVIGDALDFDGTDDYVEIAHEASLDIGDDSQGYSVSVWYRRNGDPIGTRVVFAKDNGAVLEYPFNLSVGTDGKPQFTLYDNGTYAPSIAASSSVTDDEWHHIVGVRDVASDKIRIYVDGEEDATSVDDTTVSSMKNSVAFWMARNESGGTYYYDESVIDDVRIYDRALSDVEICKLYTLGGGTCP